jgi:hypothetical protein
MGPWDLVFRGCDARDLAMLSATNRELRSLVLSYNTRSYASLHTSILSKFFSPAEAAVFRTIQAATGALISGSSALQFFERVEWEGSDLDLYTELKFTRRFINFLVKCGYVYVPYEHQQDGLAAQQDIHEAGYFEHGIADVLNFQKVVPKEMADEINVDQVSDGKQGKEEETEDIRTVQVIVAWGSTMDVILDFHSSETCYPFLWHTFTNSTTAVVMNLITAYNAICIFPMETLCCHRSIITDENPRKEKVVKAVEKYTKRGWQIFRMDPIYFTKDRMATMYFHLNQTRWVEDEKCFVVPLDDTPVEVSLYRDPIVLNSWRTYYAISGQRITGKRLWSDDSLRNNYIIGSTLIVDTSSYNTTRGEVERENNDNEEESVLFIVSIPLQC